jgi:oligoribonuclease
MDRYQSNLVWIDLEMTGLDPDHETILEIATIVTTNNLDLVAEGPTFVLHCEESYLERMDDWNKTHHGRSGLIDKVVASSISLYEAEELTLAFLEEYAHRGLSPLCGNSVWQDRQFLRKRMPRIDQFLNYRIIDVSSIKEALRRWYPSNTHTSFVKIENHRALEDIRQSIEELKHYRTFFFSENQV